MYFYLLQGLGSHRGATAGEEFADAILNPSVIGSNDDGERPWSDALFIQILVSLCWGETRTSFNLFVVYP
jgi:hypothetical protein